MLDKQETFDSEKYRRWIASLPCLISGRRDVQCAHIRRHAEAGIGRKPPDWRSVPLSCGEHARQHEVGELIYWGAYGGYETAAVLARQLYDCRFNTARATALIEEYRNRWVRRGAVTKKHKFIDEGMKGAENADRN